MTGGVDRVLIGRSEQVDLIRGTSSNYACQNCCGNSFYDGWITPAEHSGFQGDELMYIAMQSDANCYGQIYPAYPANIAKYSSTDFGVCNPNWDTGTTTGIDTGLSTISASWTGDAWFMNIGEYCDYTPVQALKEALCEVLALPRVTSISQHIIDESSQGSEVVECGRFEVTSRFQVGCPLGPGQGHTYELTGNITVDAIQLSSSTQEIANDLETCTYENVKTYRMKNRLSQTIGSAFTSYRGVVTWQEKSASKHGPGISVRATIPGTGACP